MYQAVRFFSHSGRCWTSASSTTSSGGSSSTAGTRKTIGRVVGLVPRGLDEKQLRDRRSARERREGQPVLEPDAAVVEPERERQRDGACERGDCEEVDHRRERQPVAAARRGVSSPSNVNSLGTALMAARTSTFMPLVTPSPALSGGRNKEHVCRDAWLSGPNGRPRTSNERPPFGYCAVCKTVTARQARRGPGASAALVSELRYGKDRSRRIDRDPELGAVRAAGPPHRRGLLLGRHHVLAQRSTRPRRGIVLPADVGHREDVAPGDVRPGHALQETSVQETLCQEAVQETSLQDTESQETLAWPRSTSWPRRSR